MGEFHDFKILDASLIILWVENKYMWVKGKGEEGK